MFGWIAHDQPANGGLFTRLRLAGEDVGSLYELSQAHLAQGVPSHWTPYIRVGDVDDAVRRAGALGGAVIVQPSVVAGARIALIVDAVGAPVGLWGPTGANTEERGGG